MAQGTLLVSFDHVDGRGLVVKTKDAWVRVTGTAFSVRSGDGPTLVSVLRGSVEVTTTYRDHQSGIGRAYNMEKPSSDRHCRRQNQDSPP
jgi:ferric-dicitrate binding protein FerR (iron transport regulator)